MTVNKDKVISLLKENQNERGLEHWERLYGSSELESFGLGVTQLRKLAKQVGRDHDLALSFGIPTIAM